MAGFLEEVDYLATAGVNPGHVQLIIFDPWHVPDYHQVVLPRPQNGDGLKALALFVLGPLNVGRRLAADLY